MEHAGIRPRGPIGVKARPGARPKHKRTAHSEHDGSMRANDSGHVGHGASVPRPLAPGEVAMGEGYDLPMSVELHAPVKIRRHSMESAMRIARTMRLDPRIPALIPDFDAPFFQAGLAGYSDGAMRLVARRHGCPFCVTEALLDRTLISGGKGRTREDPDILERLSIEGELGDPHENRVASRHDHPIAGQVMGTRPDEMAAAAALMVGMNYDVIDVNLACPVKKIRKANRGGHCLTDPEQSMAILRAVREAVPREIPCSVKLRRAFDDTDEMARNFERIFNAAFELGYAWATVHCRTVVQKYLGPGKWPFLADLVERHPDKLIFGSGDVWEVGDIFSMLEATGVQAVAVARGCIGNPWIFRQARQMMAGDAPAPPTIEEQRRALLEHFELSVALHGERAASRMMRKFGIKFAAHHLNSEAVKGEFIGCSNVDEWRNVFERWYTCLEPICA
jgi:tRNA-dihydrouridine synthase